MKQIISLGSAPPEETPAQTCSSTYQDDSAVERQVYKRMLMRLCPIPDGVPVSLVIKAADHDFGAYREVCVQYEDDNEQAVNFAYELEAKGPARWDPIAQYELTWFFTRAAFHRNARSGYCSDDDIPQQYRAQEPTLVVAPDATFSKILQAHPL
jgi:hypothetical protein